MPIHDWSRVKASIYHNFHVLWMSSITNRLNNDLLPAGFFAMTEQIIGRPEADVVTLQTSPLYRHAAESNGNTAVAVAKPRTRFVLPFEAERYAEKANQITVRHELGEVVAVIELVSPGNKDRMHRFRTFVDKSAALLLHGVNLLIIDPFPPGPFDPQGIPEAIGGGLGAKPFELPNDRRLTLSAFQASPMATAYIEVVAPGDPLPNMPLFLYGEHYVNVPLEETYTATWHMLPREIRSLLDASVG